MANLGDHDLSSDSFHRDFGLDDVCPYIKTGIASIIEDEVTQRFVAEELKVKYNICRINICDFWTPYPKKLVYCDEFRVFLNNLLTYLNFRVGIC